VPLTQTIHMIATLAFVLGSGVVSARLIWLSTRTRQRPELLLGCGIGGAAVLGYGVLIAGMIVRGSITDPESVPVAAIWLTGTGKILHDLGVTFFLLFTVHVFRRDDRWARALAGIAMLLLWGGMGWGAFNGSFRVDEVGSLAWLSEYVVIWSYPIWLSAESLRYWTMMRRRTALGFADPLVTNRFALWGFGSIASALAIWIASLPFAFMGQPELLETLTPSIRIGTALAGVASISCSYLAFLPPAWYARRVRAGAVADATEA
jgi:hypothetical protein